MAKTKPSTRLDGGEYATPRKRQSTLPSGATAFTSTSTSTHSRRTSSSSSSSGPASDPARGGRRTQAPACAACNHQRRKCTERCILAPYFPADRPEQFQNALRLFGIKNILRLLEEAGPEKREDCMRSIIYESDARADHPVHGCRGIERSLGNEFSREVTELAMVRQLLASCRQARRLQPPSPPRPCAALPQSTTPHMTRMYDDQVHARKKTMHDKGPREDEENEDNMIYDEINMRREAPCMRSVDTM